MMFDVGLLHNLAVDYYSGSALDLNHVFGEYLPGPLKADQC